MNNKPFIFELHEDEFDVWQHNIGLGPDKWTCTHTGPKNSTWRLITVPAEHAEEFRKLQTAQDWHPGYFDPLWTAWNQDSQ